MASNPRRLRESRKDSNSSGLHGHGRGARTSRLLEQRGSSNAASVRRSAATSICWLIWCGGLLENGANSSFISEAAERGCSDREGDPAADRYTSVGPEQAANAKNPASGKYVDAAARKIRAASNSATASAGRRILSRKSARRALTSACRVADCEGAIGGAGVDRTIVSPMGESRRRNGG